MDFPLKLGQQLKKMWLDMSAGRRVGLTLMVVICVGTVGGLSYWAAQPEYGVLFAGLTPEDAGAITSKLQAQAIPFRLAAGGSTVQVPIERVHQTRIELAVDGLPSNASGKGFELFDSSPLGMTPFNQHVNYMRALQSELAKTISKMDPVLQARVHIVRPDPSPFIREQKPTTASVMLQLRPGAVLNRNVARGIVHFVSKSIEGLTPDNVTLVDGNGKLLSDGDSNEGGSMETHMDYRRELETYLSSKAEGMLAQVLGPGKAIVRVTADINFQHLKERKETYSPDGRVITSESVTSSKSTSATAGGARGPAGAASNTGKGATGGSGGSGNSQDEVIKTEFAVSKVTQELDDKVGAVERLTIAAMIDLSQADSTKNSSGSSFSLTDAQEIIKQAVGFKGNRDEIKVTNVKLTPALPTDNSDPEGDRGQYWQNIISLVRNGSLALAALVALLLGWMVLRRIRPSVQPAKAADGDTREEAPSGPRLLSVLEQNPDAIAKVLGDWLDQSDRQQRRAA